MARITLDFAYSDGQIQLEKTSFRLSSDLEFLAVRGKTAGAYKCSGSFQWTPAVKAVSVLLLNALANSFENSDTATPMISGKRGSLASSLDYAIDKEPQWLCDMFGLDESGKTNLRRLIFRSNPGGKRPGPVSITLNESALPAENIQVLVDSIPIHDREFLNNIIAKLTDESNDAIKTKQSDSFDRSVLFAHEKRNAAWNNGLAVPRYDDDDRIPKIESVNDADIDDIYQYEEQEFPGHHATKERLKEWRDRDPSNFMCIKSAGEPVMGYYILFFLKPESMNRFLSGELLEDDVRAADLNNPTAANYSRQIDAHICVFASKRHSSMFTVDLLWHLLGRVVYLAKFGALSKIYAEATTAEGERILRRFNFVPAPHLSHSGDPLFECRLTADVIAQWQMSGVNTFCRHRQFKFAA